MGNQEGTKVLRDHREQVVKVIQELRLLELAALAIQAEPDTQEPKLQALRVPQVDSLVVNHQVVVFQVVRDPREVILAVKLQGKRQVEATPVPKLLRAVFQVMREEGRDTPVAGQAPSSQAARGAAPNSQPETIYHLLTVNVASDNEWCST